MIIEAALATAVLAAAVRLSAAPVLAALARRRGRLEMAVAVRRVAEINRSVPVYEKMAA